MEPYGYIEHIKKQIKGKRVLDIGCLGSFEDTVLLRHNQWKEAAEELIGIDNNKEFIALAYKRDAQNIYFCDVTDAKQVEKLKKSLGQFRYIIATDVIEHVGNLTMFLEGIKMLMKNDGILYLTAPNARSLVWHAMWDGRKSFLYNDDHICWFDIDTIRSLLKRSGLIIAHEYYCYNKHDVTLAEEHSVEWQENLGRRMYLHIGKV